MKECCEPAGVGAPTLVSESGRALASHFSVLVFDVLGAGNPPAGIPPATEEEPLILRNLRETHAALAALEAPGETADGGGQAGLERLQEAWNDALKFKDDALAAFEGVAEVHSVAGRWDLVVVIRVGTNDDLADLVTEKIRAVRGIVRSETLIGFKVVSHHDLERMFGIGMEE